MSPLVLLVSGALGVGKTRTAEALRDLLVAEGEHVGVIDLDWLCQADPAPDDDPWNDRLGLANLAAVWPHYLAAGVRVLVVARVVEDRVPYEAALPGADVRLVLLEASSTTRAARLTAREPEGSWRDGHLARTDEMAVRLRAVPADLRVDDDGRTPAEVAREVLDGLRPGVGR